MANYAMKIENNGQAVQFAECKVEGLTAGVEYKFTYDRKEVKSNAFRIFINEVANDNSNPILELHYSDTEGVFTPSGDTVYIAIGDNDSSSSTYCIVDNIFIVENI